MSINFFGTPWYEGTRKALAEFVDSFGFEFASRMIRDDVRAYGSMPLSYVLDEDCTEEFLRDFRELASDVEYVRIVR